MAAACLGVGEFGQVLLLGRLAITRSHQGRGLGCSLFQDAAQHIVETVSTISIRGMLVHAISDLRRSEAFYLQLGLDPSPLEPMTLMMTVANLRGAVG